jgi:hypothetical protein
VLVTKTTEVVAEEDIEDVDVVSGLEELFEKMFERREKERDFAAGVETVVREVTKPKSARKVM